MNNSEMEQSLAVMIESARIKMTNAINQVIHETSLPAYLIEGILTGIISDIRNQKNAEMLEEMMTVQNELKNKINLTEQEKKEGAE